MDRKEAVEILNANIQQFNLNSVTRFLVEFLTEKNIENQRILLFIKTISENPLYAIADTFSKCLNHSIEYYIKKFEINKVTKVSDNGTKENIIFYF